MERVNGPGILDMGMKYISSSVQYILILNKGGLKKGTNTFIFAIFILAPRFSGECGFCILLSFDYNYIWRSVDKYQKEKEIFLENMTRSIGSDNTLDTGKLMSTFSTVYTIEILTIQKW